jgi:sulfur-oxidizing protein SoxX
MQNLFSTLLSVAAVVGSLLVGTINTEAQAAESESAIDPGKTLAFDRKKGNCLACHSMGDGKLPGNIGPPLVAMQARYPDKNKLHKQIYDVRINNANTNMIPFGPHGVLSDEEIEKITEYVYTL